MAQTRIQSTSSKLARIYGVGILAFTVTFGFITLLFNFLARLNWT